MTLVLKNTVGCIVIAEIGICSKQFPLYEKDCNVCLHLLPQNFLLAWLDAVLFIPCEALFGHLHLLTHY